MVTNPKESSRQQGQRHRKIGQNHHREIEQKTEIEAKGVKQTDIKSPKNRPISSAHKRKGLQVRKEEGALQAQTSNSLRGEPPTLLKIKNDANKRFTGEFAAQQEYLRCAAKDLKFSQNTYDANIRALHIRRLSQKIKQLR